MNTFALNHAIRELRTTIKTPGDLYEIWKRFEAPSANIHPSERMVCWHKNINIKFDQ